MTTEPKNTEMMSCPFCGQQDAFVEQLDRDASVVICQGRVDQHSACLARGPVGLREHEVEDQPGRNAAVREWNRRAQTADQHGQPVAHCVERRNGSGEWINDAKSWVDGAPGREIVEYCAKYPELMRVRMAFAQPVTVTVDEALAIELPGRLSFCRVADSPIDDKAGDLLDYDDTVAAIEAAGIRVKP